MHSQESGPRGSKPLPDPLAFFPGVCSGGYLFSSGGPLSNPHNPRQFLPCLYRLRDIATYWYIAKFLYPTQGKNWRGGCGGWTPTGKQITPTANAREKS